MNMMMVQREINFLATSDPDAGARNVSINGDRFEIQLEDVLQVPSEAINTQILVEEATVWWSIPNITTGDNDKMFITYDDGVNPLLVLNITIPQGLYDLSGLNQSIIREITNLGAPDDPVLFLLSADDATQKVELIFNYTGITIDFTQPGTFREILGFNSQVIGPTAAAPLIIIADNVAAFNQVNYFLIHSDLTTKGIRFNNNYNQTITQVLIDVSPGSQIISRPFNPARIDAEELTGSKRSTLRFWITDDKNREINLNGEYFTCRVVIKYLIPHIMR
jgi:hypothetical protein